MGSRTLGVLLGLVAAVGAFLWFVDRDRPSSDQRREQARFLLSIPSEDVVAIEQANGGQANEGQANEGQTLRLERDEGGGWRITHPIEAQADALLVNQLLEALVDLEPLRVLDNIELDEAGLAQPRARVTLEAAGGDSVAVSLGAVLPASDAMIVGVRGKSQVFVVGDGLLELTSRDLDGWRDRSLFAADQADVASIQLDAGKGRPRVLLVRDGETFRLAEPVSDDADETAVEGLLSDLTTFSATRFVSESAPAAAFPAAAFATPVGRIEVELASDGSPFILEIGEPVVDGSLGRYGRIGDEVFVTESSLLSWLDRPLDSWRSTALLPFAAWTVDRVEIVEGSESLALERSGGDWRRNAATIPYTVVGDLIAAVAEARAEQVVSPAELTELEQRNLSDSAAHSLQLAITGEGGRRTELQFLAQSPSSVDPVYAFNQTRGAILLLAPEVHSKIAAAVSAVRQVGVIEPAASFLPPGVEIDVEEGDDFTSPD